MGSRLSSPERRQQVARVALELLSVVSPERLTTRAVAQASGVTQPALFRHFSSREEILAAAIDFARAELESSISAALPTAAPPRSAIHALAEALFAFTTRYPGLPRLFFYRAAGGEALGGDSAVRGPLEALVGQMIGMVAELLRAADLPAELDRERAAELLIATLQGELLRLACAGELAADARAARVSSLMVHWWSGLEVGQPARIEPEAAAPGRPEARAGLVALDTRPLLEAGTDPFEAVMAALARLANGGALLLQVPFRPVPLISALAARGFTAELFSEAEPFVLAFLGPGAPAVVDLRELEAPEPLEAVLEASHALAPGASYLARLARHPALLLPRLTERGLAFEVQPLVPEDPTSGVLLHVHRSLDG